VQLLPAAAADIASAAKDFIQVQVIPAALNFASSATEAIGSRLGQAWDAMANDPWGTLAMVGVVAAGVALCFVAGPVGVGILIGAGLAAGMGAASGNFNPRSVAIGGVIGGLTAGVGSGASLGTTVAVGAAAGGGGSVAEQTVAQGKGLGNVNWTSVAVSTGAGMALSGAARGLSGTRASAASEDLTGSCHSFSGGTLVLMADGERKRIADVKVGDKVLATDPVTGKTTARTVTALHRNQDADLADLVVRDGSGKESIVHTTQHHRFWDDTSHRWVDAADLTIGDQLHVDDGSHVTVDSVVSLSGLESMYDLTVDDVHSYYVLAGDEPVLVHNCNLLGLSENTVVVRGGTSDVPQPGEVFSGAYGQTLDEAGAYVPYGQIRPTTAGQIRAGGGTVEVVPEMTRSGVMNEHHVNICLGPGECPFGPLQPNPVPKSGRIQ